MPDCGGACASPFIQLSERHLQRRCVRGKGTDLIQNGTAIAVAKPKTAGWGADILGFATREKPLARAAEVILSKFQRRRSAIEGDDVMGFHELSGRGTNCALPDRGPDYMARGGLSVRASLGQP